MVNLVDLFVDLFVDLVVDSLEDLFVVGWWWIWCGPASGHADVRIGLVRFGKVCQIFCMLRFVKVWQC